MIYNRQRDLNSIGIYGIRNKTTNKIYVGKSKNIYKRIVSHVSCLNRKDKKQENSYLINAWHKYGRDDFELVILENCTLEELANKELYWIEKLEAINPSKGYNFRLDSSSCVVFSDEMRKNMSIAKKKLYKDNPELCKKHSHTYWKDNPDAKRQMAKKVSLSQRKYNFEQYTREGEYIKTWESVKDILQENPAWKWQNIYSVCNGYKPTYRNFIWKKVPKNGQSAATLLKAS